MIKHIYDRFAEKWYHGGRIFLYSDPHLSDVDSYKLRFPELFKEDNINKIIYEKIVGNQKANELFNEAAIVNALDQMQIDNINAVCTKNDSLIILGDIGNTDCIKKLKAGYKILIMGNHDAGATNYQRIITEKEVDGKIIKEDNHLFDEVYEGPLFISEKILLSHEPIDLPFGFVIHGHVHDKNYKSKGMNLCAEVINFKPVCFNELVSAGTFQQVPTIHRNTINAATKRKQKKQKSD